MDGEIINSISVNTLTRTVVIGFGKEKIYLILKDVARYYDTGVINAIVTCINQQDNLGITFHSDIKSSGFNPADYSWFQIVTDNKKVFEAAIKEAEYRHLSETDLL